MEGRREVHSANSLLQDGESQHTFQTGMCWLLPHTLRTMSNALIFTIKRAHVWVVWGVCLCVCPKSGCKDYNLMSQLRKRKNLLLSMYKHMNA